LFNNYKYSTILPLKQNALILLNKNKESFNLDRNYLEWLSGFTDSEGNFTITLRNKEFSNINSEESFSYSSVTLTFKIGLHIDDLKVLESIKEKLQCGKISISESNNRCNYFVSDAFSLIHIIIPIFNYALLNSSKYSQFKVFEEAVKLINDKAHLSLEGKKKIIDCKNRINKDYKLPDFINITDA
jgi:hypothetical protein